MCAIRVSQEKPYVMVREDKNLTGNSRYEGFCIDLLKAIANLVDFNYDIRLVPDHMYGVYDPETKQWNGIVRELMDKASRDFCINLHPSRWGARARCEGRRRRKEDTLLPRL
jgi:Ligated ion channel L-glutamate- and glycine-binding site